MNSYLLTATESVPIEKTWNLVDWILTTCFADSASAGGAITIVGALLCMIVPYLLGSLLPSVWISKRMYGTDVRDFGSGTAGCANLLRVYGKKAALLDVAAEFVLVAAAVWFGRLVWEVNGGALAGFFVVFGGMFPAFFRLRGGKGGTALLMVALVISPLTALILLVVFLIGSIGTRMVSFGTCMTALLYPLILTAFANRGLNGAMAVITACFVVYVHRENLKRMREGKETKLELAAWFGRKK